MPKHITYECDACGIALESTKAIIEVVIAARDVAFKPAGKEVGTVKYLCFYDWNKFRELLRMDERLHHEDI